MAGDYLHESTPIKNSRLSILFEPEISLDPEGEFETFDLDTSSGEFFSLFNTKLPGHRSIEVFDQREQNAGSFLVSSAAVIWVVTQRFSPTSVSGGEALRDDPNNGCGGD